MNPYALAHPAPPFHRPVGVTSFCRRLTRQKLLPSHQVPKACPPNLNDFGVSVSLHSCPTVMIGFYPTPEKDHDRRTQRPHRPVRRLLER
jgi:hypothetical protein